MLLTGPTPSSLKKIEGKACYRGHLLAPAEDFSMYPKIFGLRQKIQRNQEREKIKKKCDVLKKGTQKWLNNSKNNFKIDKKELILCC